MELDKLGIYLKNLAITTERKEGKDEKVIVLTCTVEPFTRELSETMAPGNKTRLFTGDGNPAENVLDMTLGMHAPNYFAAAFRRAPDLKRPSIGPLATVRLERKLKVRRDKETPAYAASFKLNLPFPSAEDLQFLAHNVSSQMWLSLVEEQGRLVDPPSEKDEPEDEDEGGRKQGRLAAVK